MFTLKIYADGCTFLRLCTDLQIIYSGSETFAAECAALKEDYSASGIIDDFKPNSDSDLSVEAQQEHYLESLMPYAIMHYNGSDGTWALYGDDRVYVINEQGKTIENIKQPNVLITEVEE